MSRWTENKRKYSKHGADICITTPNIYKVITDQKEFIYRTHGKLDYKETMRRFKAAGYTNISIIYMGRDVTF